MSLQARRELLDSIRARYHRGDKNSKSKILDEFTQATGYGRKYAIALLNSVTNLEKQKLSKQRSRKYGEDVQKALIQVWRLANEICSKRLIPFLPDFMEALERTGNIQLQDDVKKKLLTLCPDTADRLLREERKSGQRGRSTTRAGKLLKRQIPIRTFSDWNDVVPGFFEADLVAHCGNSASGTFLNSLVLTDIATAWTECFALLRKSEMDVLDALRKAQKILPIKLLGFDSDNGSEFINTGLLEFCKEEKITFTRSRAYKKNDQAHVEERNGSVVRRIVGYDRYEGVSSKTSLQDLYDVVRLYVNYFQPTMKLLSKQRDGQKVSRKHDRAQTPYRRMLDSPAVSDNTKKHLRETYSRLDPVQLLSKIEEQQDILWKKAWNRIPAAIARAESSIVVTKEKSLIAAKQVRTQRQYRSSRKPRKPVDERYWRTRKDPFENVREDILELFRGNPQTTAKQVLDVLKQRYPGQFIDSQQRTLMRILNKLRSSVDGKPIPAPGRQTYPKHYVRKKKLKEHQR